jgi:hypothetical protein
VPASSTIQILYDDTDITRYVIFSSATFSLQAGAQPGTFEITVKDVDQVLSFVTGHELRLIVDDRTLFGGYVKSVTRKFAFPADDTVSRPTTAVKSRQFVLRGVDYNTLFDTRFTRNPADYLHLFPSFPKTSLDGDLIRDLLCGSYLDIPAGFDTSAHVDNVVAPFDPLNLGRSGVGLFLQPGSSWRASMDDLAQFSGAVYYLSGAKFLEYHALEDVLAPFGFSDVPDGTDFIGFRDLDLTEDGSVMANDAMIWGGSQYAGTGKTVFAREQNGPSIAEHGRWQRAETHFGEQNYLLQDGVTARARVIVDGAPGAVGGDDARGLRFPQWSARLTWYAKDVPGREHLLPGNVVTFNFWVMSEDGGVTPLIQVLPLRQLTITFPNLDSSAGGDPYVAFTGSFGLQLSDPYTLWTFLRHALAKVQKVPGLLATSDDTTPIATYGSLFSGPFSAAPDGSTRDFSLPNGFGYIAGTTQVYRDGKLLIPGGIDYEETDPIGGLLQFTSPPALGAILWARCYLT